MNKIEKRRRRSKTTTKESDARKRRNQRHTGLNGMSLKTILVAVDFLHQSLRALDFAEDLGRCLKSRIVLAHVLDPLHAPGRLDSRKLRHLRAEALEDAKEKLAKIANDKRSLENHVLKGMVHTSIIQFAKRIDADLIVMGSNSRTGVNRFLAGSNAAKVVRHARGPVLVVR